MNQEIKDTTIVVFGPGPWQDVVNFAIRLRRSFPGYRISIDYARCPAVAE